MLKSLYYKLLSIALEVEQEEEIVTRLPAQLPTEEPFFDYYGVLNTTEPQYYKINYGNTIK